jgi:hypothetical protein
MIVIQDKESGKIKVMLIDQNDAMQFKVKLNEDAQLYEDDAAIEKVYKESYKGTEFEFEKLTRNRFRNTRIALYDLTTGVYMQGKERIDVKALEADQQFKVIKIQAKFLQGSINYSKEELVLLKEWFKSQDIVKMKKLFEDNIIPWAAINAKNYAESDLAHLFQKEIAALPRKQSLFSRTFGL